MHVNQHPANRKSSLRKFHFSIGWHVGEPFMHLLKNIYSFWVGGGDVCKKCLFGSSYWFHSVLPPILGHIYSSNFRWCPHKFRHSYTCSCCIHWCLQKYAQCHDFKVLKPPYLLILHVICMSYGYMLDNTKAYDSS